MPSAFVNSSSPSKVPAVVQVPVGNTKAHTPPLALVIDAVMVFKTVVCPTSLILSFIEPPDKFIGAQVASFSTSKVCPAAAVLLSFNVKVNSGSVSPTTNFIVSEYAILNYTYKLL